MMPRETNLSPGELLRLAMRHWVSGVAVATSRVADTTHGMTVNSFLSISLDPPLVTVTMNNETRTCALVRESSVFAITVLGERQQPLADQFSGRSLDTGDRMAGVEVFSLVTGAPLLLGGLAFFDCRVVHQFDMPRSTLLIGEVLAAQSIEPEDQPPLVYHNRAYVRLA